MLQSCGNTSTDFATRAYVDEVATGIKSKPAVRAATTANLAGTYNNGTNGVGATLTASSNGAFPTIDGYSSWAQGNSVLLKNQTTAAQNGRYILTTVGDVSNPWVLTRCGLCDEASEIPGAYIFVVSGTENGSKGYVLTVSNPETYVVGTDSIIVTQFSSADSFVAGNGLVLSGNIFNVQTANSARIVVNTDDIDLATVTQTNSNGANTVNFVSSIAVDNFGRITGTEKANVSFAGYATLESPTFTGNVTIPANANISGYALLASPTFTGTPTAPTANAGTSNGQIATTQYVDTAVSSLSATAGNTYIESSIIAAKGDLIVGTANDTEAILTVGTNGYFLKANSSAATGLEWAEIPTINALDDVGDVTITGNATGQFLKYNGSAWVNDSIPTINALNDVGDVTITSVATNDILAWDGTAWINKTNPTIGGNLTVTGNLTVQGNTTTVSTEELHVSDNIIVLNHDVTGSPTENAGIEVERGTSTNVLIRWNETDDVWEFTNDGTTYQRITSDTVTNAQTAAYTLVLGDRSKMVEMNVASGHNLTVPANSNVAFPVGTTITVLQTGAGQTTIAAQGGVTVNATPGLKLRAQWSSATLIKRATDTWVALGDLAA